MKVESPIFGGNTGVDCDECPYTDHLGALTSACYHLCNGAAFCATDDETYAEACALAEAAEKGAE